MIRKSCWPLALLLAGALVGLGCECERNEAGQCVDIEGNVTLWGVLDDSTPRGPSTWVSQRPIVLFDGTKVVCVAITSHLWCKEVGHSEGRATIPKPRSSTGRESPSPEGLSELDFGG
jgi:hypothetical protein